MLCNHRIFFTQRIRPVINIQNNTGSFFSPTLIVIPLTTELKKLNQPTHYILNHQNGLNEATGKRKQKWESYKTMTDAKRRKAEIEYREELGTLVIHQCQTVNEKLLLGPWKNEEFYHFKP
ncbi:MAG: type II toxin-antitoxin system PemK/MazF family toxin, partial [Lachnospiraceae bacterium]|nr:type II toxin-antitoxin system PemK/MazF family toxin [Lachnospiraceae bacterium]